MTTKFRQNMPHILFLYKIYLYILAYKSLPRISRPPPKNQVHMLSKIFDPCISRRYSKLTTCCITVRILGGFYDAQLKCFLLDAIAISDRCDCN